MTRRLCATLAVLAVMATLAAPSIAACHRQDIRAEGIAQRATRVVERMEHRAILVERRMEERFARVGMRMEQRMALVVARAARAWRFTRIWD